MPAEQELDERVATTLKRLDVTTRESWPWVTTGELEDLIRDLRAELQAAQERERALREIVAKHEKVCSDCDGAGYLQDGECDWCGASGFVCDDLALAWADVRSLAAQRTEEPSAIGEHLAEARAVEEHQERKHAERGDDEGLEPIETSPLTEREPDL